MVEKKYEKLKNQNKNEKIKLKTLATIVCFFNNTIFKHIRKYTNTEFLLFILSVSADFALSFVFFIERRNYP